MIGNKYKRTYAICLNALVDLSELWSAQYYSNQLILKPTHTRFWQKFTEIFQDVQNTQIYFWNMPVRLMFLHVPV